jgi:hypothetical protein
VFGREFVGQAHADRFAAHGIARRAALFVQPARAVLEEKNERMSKETIFKK